MLPSERPTGPIRRVLHYFGLANATDERLRASAPTARAAPVADPPQPPPDQDDANERRAARERTARKTLAYFGLAEDPDPDPPRSRYGNLSPELDQDVDALRARVAELEARLAALEPGDR